MENRVWSKEFLLEFDGKYKPQKGLGW
jgi:hypothetical protein